MDMRGHHLLCMRYFLGKGYNADFVTHFSETLERISQGDSVRVVSHTGEVCSACPHNKGGCQKKGVHSEARMKEIDTHVMTTLGIQEGESVKIAELDTQIRAKLPVLMHICKTCQWKPLCDRFPERQKALGIPLH